MKCYLQWGQVQRHLNEQVEQGKAPCSFYDAVRALWEAGIYQVAEELPVVSFEAWNVDDLDELERLMDNTPVDLSHFFRNFEQKARSKPAFMHALKLEGAPIRIAVNQAMGQHAHSVFRILYVMRGQAQLLFGSEKRILPENTVCIIAPNFYHDLVAEPGCLMLSIALNDETVEETLYALLKQDNVISDFFRSGLGGGRSGYLLFHLKQIRQIRSIYQGILHECYTKGEYSKAIYMDYLQILFAMLLRCGTGVESIHSIPMQGALPMLSVLKYIQANFRDVTLSQVAELFHYEPSYLGKQIKACIGRNYTDIIQELRINEAKALLEATDLSMDEIAEQAGYDSRVHFFRSFRAVVGVTPGQYRKKCTEIQADTGSKS